MSVLNLRTFDVANNRPGLVQSDQQTVDFLSLRIGASNLEISETGGELDLNGVGLRNLNLDATPTNYTPTDALVLADHLAGIDAALGTASGNEPADDVFRVVGSGDATKKLAFEVDGITTGTVRTVTMPDEDVDLGDMAKESILSSNSNGEGASTVGIEDSGAIYTATDVEGALAEVKGVADAAIPSSEKGANNGVAELDGAGKVPVAQLPNSIMEYQGTFNASTDTPDLTDGSGSAGDVYRVSVAGTVDHGSGNITYGVGDYAIYNGTTWEKADTTDAVASVNSQTGVVVLDTDDISEGSALYHTDERAQDAVGGILANTGDVAFTYDDAGNEITADLNADSVDADKINSDVAGLGLQQASDGSLESGSVQSLQNDDGAAFAAGEFGVIEADGNVVKAQANGAYNLGSGFVMALEAVSSAATGKFAVGSYKLGGFTGLAEESPVYVSRGIAGDYQQNLTSFASGEHIILLGQAISPTEILFNPQYIAEYNIS